MAENPYAPPNAELTVGAADRQLFYVVGLRKFLVLFVATMGIYQIFWFYENWRAYREASGEKLWPVARALFSIFFVHRLFRLVQARLDNARRAVGWDLRSYATWLVVLLIVSNAMDRAAMRSNSSQLVDLLSLVILLPLGFVLYRAQVSINASCDDPQGTTNSEFTLTNYLVIALGVLWWGLVVAGFLLAG